MVTPRAARSAASVSATSSRRGSRAASPRWPPRGRPRPQPPAHVERGGRVGKPPQARRILGVRARDRTRRPVLPRRLVMDTLMYHERHSPRRSRSPIEQCVSVYRRGNLGQNGQLINGESVRHRARRGARAPGWPPRFAGATSRPAPTSRGPAGGRAGRDSTCELEQRLRDRRALRVEIGHLLELGHRLIEIALAIVGLTDPELGARGQRVPGKLVDSSVNSRHRWVLFRAEVAIAVA